MDGEGAGGVEAVRLRHDAYAAVPQTWSGFGCESNGVGGSNLIIAFVRGLVNRIPMQERLHCKGDESGDHGHVVGFIDVLLACDIPRSRWVSVAYRPSLDSPASPRSIYDTYSQGRDPSISPPAH